MVIALDMFYALGWIVWKTFWLVAAVLGVWTLVKFFIIR